MTDIPYVATTPFVPTDDFEGLCDVISVLALTYVPIEQVQQFIENLVGTALFDGPPTHSEYPFNAVKGVYSSGNAVMSAWFSQSRTLGG
ncbi:hypothetical protein, partial [Xanthomonas arboricola]|uniref:hypothetical protein n=1 Tax=Xanthomonas arboricola TaxID=56448 RepID=UPI0019CF8378